MARGTDLFSPVWLLVHEHRAFAHFMPVRQHHWVTIPDGCSSVQKRVDVLSSPRSCKHRWCRVIEVGCGTGRGKLDRGVDRLPASSYEMGRSRFLAPPLL